MQGEQGPAGSAAGATPSGGDGVPRVPVSDRDGKWSPLGLGILSLFCDPCMVPSIMAVSRAAEDLRRVREREALGDWAPDHATVRSQAIWGLALALIRPGIMVFAFALALLVTPFHMRDESLPLYLDDEGTEVLDRLSARDESVRATAMAHLQEIAPSLSREQTLRALQMAQREVAAGGDDEAITRLIWAASHNVGREHVELALHLYPHLPVDARTAALRLMAQSPTVGPPALARAIRNDPAFHGGDGPAPALVPELLNPLGPAEVASALLAVTSDPAARHAALDTVGWYCRNGAPGDATAAEAVTAAAPQLVQQWEGLRDELADPGAGGETAGAGVLAERRDRAAALLEVMGCASDGSALVPALREAESHPDIYVSLGATLALLRLGERPSRRAIARQAATPQVRIDLLRGLREAGQERLMPARMRTQAEVELEAALLTAEGQLRYGLGRPEEEEYLP